MTDAPAPQGPAPKPGILDIAPYVGGKSRIDGVAEPMKLSSNENMLGAGEKARAAYEAAITARLARQPVAQIAHVFQRVSPALLLNVRDARSLQRFEQATQARARLVADAGQRMQGIVGGVEDVSHLMREISAASQEQSVGIEQINQTVVQMDQATQQNAALVEEATAAARELQNQAGTLTEAVSVFRQQEPLEVSRVA